MHKLLLGSMVVSAALLVGCGQTTQPNVPQDAGSSSSGGWPLPNGQEAVTAPAPLTQSGADALPVLVGDLGILKVDGMQEAGTRVLDTQVCKNLQEALHEKEQANVFVAHDCEKSPVRLTISDLQGEALFFHLSETTERPANLFTVIYDIARKRMTYLDLTSIQDTDFVYADNRLYFVFPPLSSPNPKAYAAFDLEEQGMVYQD